MNNTILRTILILTATVLSMFITAQLSVNEWKIDMQVNQPSKWTRYNAMLFRTGYRNDILNSLSKEGRYQTTPIPICGSCFDDLEPIFFISDFLHYYRNNCLIALSIMTLSFIMLFEILFFGSKSPISCVLNNGWINKATLPRVAASVAVLSFLAGCFMLSKNLETEAIAITPAMCFSQTYCEIDKKTNRLVIRHSH